MPYKASGKWVLILKNGRWVPFYLHKSAEAAKAYAAALNKNVPHK